MKIDLDSLLAGSIVRTFDDELYVKDEQGDWHRLSAVSTAVWSLRDLRTGELVHKAKKPFNYPIGTVLSFMDGRCVVVRKDDGDWYYAGSKASYDNTNMESIIGQYDDVEVLR